MYTDGAHEEFRGLHEFALLLPGLLGLTGFPSGQLWPTSELAGDCCSPEVSWLVGDLLMVALPLPLVRDSLWLFFKIPSIGDLPPSEELDEVENPLGPCFICCLSVLMGLTSFLTGGS